MNKFGFIITRHVNSEKTNKYWNNCVKLIRTFYPLVKIIIIDDFSDKNYLKSEFEYKNIIVIESEYKGRGELLPYIYYLKYKWFDNAIIIHDSIFIHKRIPFEYFATPVIPLWHHTYDKENLNNLLRISSYLKNNSIIKKHLLGNDINILGMNKNQDFLCFGSMCYINYNFLNHLEHKYKITNLVNAIHNRTDRCGLERIMGILFSLENSQLKNIKSLFGSIFSQPHSFNYTYDKYKNDILDKKLPSFFIKVWTGR